VKDRNPSERPAQVAIVVNQDVRKFTNGCLQIRKRAWKPGRQFLGWHVVAALRNAHGDALIRYFRTGEANVAQYYCITRLDGLLQEAEFVTCGIRKNRFEYKALVSFHELSPQSVRHFRCGVRIEVQFVSQYVSVDKSKAGRFQMGMVESGLTGAIRTCDSHQERSLIELSKLPQSIDLKRRSMNLPTVRVPSASIRTSRPDFFEYGS
jgi:hypothetical protein